LSAECRDGKEIAVKSNTLFILALILFDGVALAWGLWEFWSIRPQKRLKAEQSPPAQSPESSGHPEG
jgi:hypothetical protein